MSTFYEFLTHSNEPQALALPGPERSSSLVDTFESVKLSVTNLALSVDTIPNNNAEKFGQDVAKLVTSDSFLKELSEGVQTPMLGETEDEFVSRCKKTLFGLIDKHLTKKQLILDAIQKMKALQLFTVLAYSLFRNTGKALKYATVQEWIATNSNRDNIGRGYAGGRLPESSSSGFAELIRENRGDIVRINAAIIFDKRSGPVARKTWDAKKLDAKLEKLFGNTLRIRIDVQVFVESRSVAAMKQHVVTQTTGVMTC